MNIYGEKIVLRAIETSDNEMLLEMLNDPETEMMVGGGSWPQSLSGQMKWFNELKDSPMVLRCIIADKNDNSPLGMLILDEIDRKNGTGHIHIKLRKGDTRGKGYGTDSVNIMVKYAFEELRLNCIFCNILVYNKASIRLFEKCGFHKVGVLRSRIYKRGEYHDVYAFSKLASDAK